jgi:Glycosyltransferase sugar-binding region containing DXD motif
VLRLEILYQFGGIYSDTDVICLKSFEDFLSVDFFAGIETNVSIHFFPFAPYMGTAIFGAVPGHPILDRCLNLIRTAAEKPGIALPFRSGPGLLSRVYCEALHSGMQDLLLLPCTYLYPLLFLKRQVSLDEIKASIKPESQAIHLWRGSWLTN